MAMINVQVKLSEETVKKIDALRGPELGWAQAAVVRFLVEEALKRHIFMPDCSVDKTSNASTEPINA